MKKELILVDASWVIHRMGHVHRDLGVNLFNGDKLSTGHLFGVARLLKSLNRGYPEADIIFCLDGVATHGKGLNPDYKANRVKSSSFTAIDDLGVLVECAVAFKNTKVAFHRDLEADEIISYYASLHKGEYEMIIVYSADQDMLQLIGGNVFVAKEFENGLLKLVDETVYYSDEQYLGKFYGCQIGALTLYRAMVGDSSDNLKGVPRIRKRVAQALAEGYGSVDRLCGACENGSQDFPEGFRDVLPTIRTNYEIMKLPNSEMLKTRGTVPILYALEDLSLAEAMFSLYRIKSSSPVSVVDVDSNLEAHYLGVRKVLNESWKHPNNVK